MIITIVSIILGGAIGWCLPILDKIAYIYILHPEAQLSQYIQFRLAKKQFRQVWETLRLRSQEFDQLTTRGILFQVAWLVLAIFSVTSVPSLFGQALVMGLGIRVLIEEWREWWKDKTVLQQRLFWQIKRTVSPQELKIYLIVKTILVVWLCSLLVG